MSTLLRDLIDIPERTSADDYVLRLTENVGDRANAALRDYVVTEHLAEAFEQALSLVSQALTTGESKGAYLQGSFGSGKSHFMAVLHAIVRGEPEARTKEGLTEVVSHHHDALAGKNLLPLAFHLLGADSFEERIFGQYVDQIRALHPDCELPRLHRTDGILADADKLRATIGDEAFLAGLGNNPTSGAASGWGSFGAATSWTLDSYDAARHAPHGNDQRAQLVTALVANYFTHFVASAAYVDLDSGLAEMSRHAKTLGYDGVILFLDELVLWLAIGAHEPEFFRREVQKLTKLVESGTGRREIPLISFIAKQIDLKRWFADIGASGSQQANLEQTLSFQEGRFPSIVLGDDNLPYVAHQRLLKPKDDAAGRRIADAFADIDRTPGIWRVLLNNVNTDDDNRGSDEAAFKLTYPFSPALVSTLRSLAGAMQRERTALKVMQQMLVDRRDILSVDDIIPVGDCFDLVVMGGEPLDSATAALFTSARDLWTTKLQPLLMHNHHLTPTELANGQATAGYAADARLAKTLLLSAVAPRVPALRALTPERLAHLNHGSIVAPIPGAEAQTVLAKVNTWAADIPEIHVESGRRNPTITVQLANVDYESVVQKALAEDNEGRRRQLIHRMVADELHIDLDNPQLTGCYTRTLTWRGTPREIDIIFGNVRDASYIPDQVFEARPHTWRFIIDHPFDEAGHSSAEDHNRADQLLARDTDQNTIIWLPRFLSDDRLRDLSRLVILDWLLSGTGERWQQHSNHLREEDRILARNILDGQRNTLSRHIRNAIQQAYGAATPQPGNLTDDTHEEKELISLKRSFNAQRPVGATLGDAFENLATHAWDATYPDHPRFEPGNELVKPKELLTIKEHVEKAMGDPERRIPISGELRPLRHVAAPLGVGQASDTHFVFGDAYLTPWATHLDKALALRGNHDDPVTVNEARGWVSQLNRGLTEPLTDLVIIAWAALRQRVWYDGGGQARATAPDPGKLTSGMEMRVQEMPTDDEWEAAKLNAAHLFGESASPYLNPAAVADLAARIRDRATHSTEPAHALTRTLRDKLPPAGVTDADIAASPRLTTALLVEESLHRLTGLSGVALIRALGDINLDERGLHAGKSLASATEVIDTLNRFDWDWLTDPLQARNGEGTHAEDAATLINKLIHRLCLDEYDSPAKTVLREAERDVRNWLRQKTPIVDPTPPNPTIRKVDPIVPRKGTFRGTGKALRNDIDAFLDTHPDTQIEVTWRVVE